MLLLLNAKVYTFEAAKPQATGLAVDQGRIIHIGDSDELRDAFGAKATSVDLEGRTVIPGLTDAHLHLEQYALGLQKVGCSTPTLALCLERVFEASKKIPAGSWILGHGWNQNEWQEGFGTAAQLDEIAPHHPVYLTAKSLHAAWVNSLALKNANIHLETPNPPDGRIGRDHNGNPNGIVFESAMQLIEQVIQPPALEFLVEAIADALSELSAFGLTGIHDFDRARCFSALQMVRHRNGLRLRILKSIPRENLSHAAELGLRASFGDDFLRLGGVKLFADGALGPRTAAMLQPYESEPDNRGMLFFDAEEMFELGRTAVEAGLPLWIHAIGDRANHEVLNGFEELRKFESLHHLNSNKLRHRIEHVQLIHPQDAPRLAKLNIIASMQPIHATSDMEMADRFWGKRSISAYAIRTQLESGARLAFGSDAPVESPNPFQGIHAAVTRQRGDGDPGQRGWHPEQRITVQQAIEAYTVGPAFAAQMEDRLGKIAPGYFADLVVLDQDPFTCQADELQSIRPIKTMVGGQWVFEA